MTYQDVARLFLADVGGPDTPQMVAAVVAWTRQESGGTILGNNPWNLHGTAGDYGGLAIGDRYAGPGDAHVATFGHLADGVQAAVDNLTSLAPQSWTGYAAVLAVARAGNAPGFLEALARSAWSAGRYGTKNGGPNDLLPLYQAALKETAVASQPASLTPAAEPVAYAGLLTSLILAGIQYATGAGILSGSAGTQLSGQAAVIANALVTILPVLIALVTRQAVTPNGNVPVPVTPTPVPVPTPPLVPPPQSSPPASAPTYAVTVLGSEAPEAATGSIPANTPRYALNGEPLSAVGPSILALASKDKLEGSLSGHFYRTATAPPVYIAYWSVTPLMAPAPVPVVIAPPTPPSPAPVAKTAFVRIFGDTPSHIWDVTLAKIQAAGQYRQNADGSWSAKTIQEWRSLAQQYGGAPGVAAYDVQNGLPSAVLAWNGMPVGGYPADMQANVDKFFTGVCGTSGSSLHPGVMEYFAFRDGQLLGQKDGSGSTDTAAFGASLGLNPNVGWYD